MALWFATLWFQAPDGKTAQSDWVIEAETPAQAHPLCANGPQQQFFRNDTGRTRRPAASQAQRRCARFGNEPVTRRGSLALVFAATLALFAPQPGAAMAAQIDHPAEDVDLLWLADGTAVLNIRLWQEQAPPFRHAVAVVSLMFDSGTVCGIQDPARRSFGA